MSILKPLQTFTSTYQWLQCGHHELMTELCAVMYANQAQREMQ